MLPILLGKEYEGWHDPRESVSVRDKFMDILMPGVVAIGGTLDPDRIYDGYKIGVFPWFSFRSSEIMWHCPMERFVIFPEEIHVSHSMRTLLNKGTYKVTFNRAFDRVIRNCSNVDGRSDHPCAWLGEDMIDAYTILHERGLAESVEVWDSDGELVGGLYGVVYNDCFMGESMFSYVPSGSKIALIALAKQMQANGGKIIDCQMHTPHLASMGGRHIPYQEYLDILHPDGNYGFLPPEPLSDVDADALFNSYLDRLEWNDINDTGNEND